MIVFFDNDYEKNLYEGKSVAGKPKFSQSVIRQFILKVEILKNAKNSHSLRAFKSLNFEKLEGHDNLYSIRVNRSFRIEFRMENDNITLLEMVYIEKLSNHYQ